MSETLNPAFSLRHGAFFASLGPALREQVLQRSTCRACAARTLIYAPGDPAEAVYWVHSGRVKVSHITGDGRELTFRHLRAGDMFGEDCLGEDCREPRACRRNHAESMEASVLVCLPARDFRDLMTHEIEFTLAVTRQSWRRVREVESTFCETVFRPVRARVAARLLGLYRQGDPGETTLRITHQEVANLVGSTRETTTSVLHMFRKAGVLQIANRRVTLLDPEALRMLARDG